jgi:hypothetical protein
MHLGMVCIWNGLVLEICNTDKSCHPECQVPDTWESQCITIPICTPFRDEAIPSCIPFEMRPFREEDHSKTQTSSKSYIIAWNNLNDCVLCKVLCTLHQRLHDLFVL